MAFNTEVELVMKLIQHFNNRLVFQEVGAGYGISDLVMIRNPSEFQKFSTERSGVYLKTLDEVKVLYYLKKKKSASFKVIEDEHFFSKSKLKNILKNLMSYGAIIENDLKYSYTNKVSLFSPKVYAFEAKLEDWQKGLAQALRYQRFASKTYLVLDEDFVHRVNHEELMKHNVGLISVGGHVREIIKPASSKPTDKIMNYKIAEELLKKLELSSL